MSRRTKRIALAVGLGALVGAILFWARTADASTTGTAQSRPLSETDSSS